jgi:hypothetical protein
MSLLKNIGMYRTLTTSTALHTDPTTEFIQCAATQVCMDWTPQIPFILFLHSIDPYDVKIKPVGYRMGQHTHIIIVVKQ